MRQRLRATRLRRASSMRYREENRREYRAGALYFRTACLKFRALHGLRVAGVYDRARQARCRRYTYATGTAGRLSAQS